MSQFLRSTLYRLFVRSGFLYFFFPLLKRAQDVIIRISTRSHNFQIVDDGGSTINTTLYEGKLFPPISVSQAASIKDFPVRQSDILLAGYPKTGCHWTYEILQIMRNKTTSLSKYGKGLGGMIDLYPGILLDALPSPRVINSHLLYDDLPQGIKTNKTKIVLTIRGAKDTVVSYYNHNKNLHSLYKYDGLFENYYKLFMAGKLEYGDFFDYYHNWAKVMTSGPVNEIFVLNFDEMKKDPVPMIMKLAKFLDIEMTHQTAVAISEVSSFQSMKKARSKSSIDTAIFRKGKTYSYPTRPDYTWTKISQWFYRHMPDFRCFHIESSCRPHRRNKFLSKKTVE